MEELLVFLNAALVLPNGDKITEENVQQHLKLVLDQAGKLARENTHLWALIKERLP